MLIARARELCLCRLGVRSCNTNKFLLPSFSMTFQSWTATWKGPFSFQNSCKSICRLEPFESVHFRILLPTSPNPPTPKPKQEPKRLWNSKYIKYQTPTPNTLHKKVSSLWHVQRNTERGTNRKHVWVRNRKDIFCLSSNEHHNYGTDLVYHAVPESVSVPGSATVLAHPAGQAITSS